MQFIQLYKTYATPCIFCEYYPINRRWMPAAVQYHPHIKQKNGTDAVCPQAAKKFGCGRNSTTYIGTCPPAV
jgi:hypothetical protein